MDVKDIIILINEVGFAIFISTVLIIRVDKKLQTIISTQQVILERVNKK